MYDNTLRHLIAWASAREAVRAVLLTSTRARPDGALDPFSDYDIILAVTDIQPFFADRRWLSDFGPVLVVYRDPIRVKCGYESFACITQYEHDRLKIDFTLLPADMLRHLPADCDLRDELDAGYQVLLDKDGVTAALPAPTYRAYIPAPPSAERYHERIEVFFHEAAYVAKNIWRDELLPAKYSFDQVMKQEFVCEMLVWHLEIRHGWTIRPGVLGKGLKRYTRPDWWAQLESTYVGAEPDANWETLFHLIDLYRAAAVEVGAALGYAYPHDLDRRVCDYLRAARALPRDAQSG